MFWLVFNLLNSKKYLKYSKNLHMVFVDFERAYDRVPLQVLWWAIKKKVPGKYVHATREESACAMYKRANTYVRSAAGVTDKFSVALCLNQGSALSPYLFLLVIDALTAKIQEETS